MAHRNSNQTFPYLDLRLDRFTDFLKLKKENRTEYIWDPLRKKYLILQPEEFVRQLLIRFLHQEFEIPLIRMSSEHGVKLFSTKKRCDLVVFNRDGSILLLAECKSYKRLDSLVTMEQIENYNLALQTDNLLITNGPKTLFFSRANQEERFQSRDEMIL
nr:type I restriction enzyme HsdR N-terminal domain-containing protein [Saprospiraceae bacterium]